DRLVEVSERLEHDIHNDRPQLAQFLGDTLLKQFPCVADLADSPIPAGRDQPMQGLNRRRHPWQVLLDPCPGVAQTIDSPIPGVAQPAAYIFYLISPGRISEPVPGSPGGIYGPLPAACEPSLDVFNFLGPGSLGQPLPGVTENVDGPVPCAR